VRKYISTSPSHAIPPSLLCCNDQHLFFLNKEKKMWGRKKKRDKVLYFDQLLLFCTTESNVEMGIFICFVHIYSIPYHFFSLGLHEYDFFHVKPAKTHARHIRFLLCAIFFIFFLLHQKVYIS
jgi:hypothetical protein